MSGMEYGYKMKGIPGDVSLSFYRAKSAKLCPAKGQSHFSEKSIITLVSLNPLERKAR